MRNHVYALLVGTLAFVLASAAALGVWAAAAPSSAAADHDVSPFRGLGTWVDVYDYVPAFQTGGGPPSVIASSLDDMAALGVKTLYLQSAQDDTRAPGATVDRKLLGAFLRRAHDDGVRVVAWYLPTFSDTAADLHRIRGLASFRSHGERFDGIALDLEATKSVPDPRARNAALVRLTHQARNVVRDTPLGAIVLEPLLLEQVNTKYWPGFPWRKIRSSFDVWMPMSYWTNRDSSSGLRDGFKYTNENIRRVRKDLGDPHATVHAIGGIADSADTQDYLGFVQAAKRQHAIGWSVYDFNTTTSGVWPRLRGR